MKRIATTTILFFCTVICFAQTDTTKWLRAFPITGYIVDLNDTVRIVQVYLPDGPVLRDKQPAVLKGMYTNAHADTITIGSGRCNLIKGEYYYFTINIKQSRHQPKENDLLYTMVGKPLVYYGRLIKIASHFVGLQNVYEEPLYDRYSIFKKWTASDEEAVIDSIRNDIRFTGDHFLKNNPSMNIKIAGGKFDGQMVLNVMTRCDIEDVKNFLDYVIVRPRLYAGREWKVSEVFATWLSSGAPTVGK